MIPEGCCGCQWLESTKHQLGKLSAESSFPTVDSWRRSYIDGFLPDLHSMVQMEGVCVQAIWWLKECVYKLFGYWRSVCTSNLVVGRYVCVCVYKLPGCWKFLCAVEESVFSFINWTHKVTLPVFERFVLRDAVYQVFSESYRKPWVLQ